MKKTIGYAVLAFVGLSLAYAIFQERSAAPGQEGGRDTTARSTQPSAAADVNAAAKQQSPAPAEPGKPRRRDAAAIKPAAADRTTIARYCHGTARCSNCMKIEEYSRVAIETGLRKELDSGRLKFETLNIDEPANRHFIKDYGLYTKSLVLVERSAGKEGRYKVLNDVWEHLDDKEAFLAYVKTETEAFLK